MQGDYFGFSQGPPTQAYYPAYGYAIGTALPTHRNLDKLKKSKHRHSDGRKYEELTNSTDESIHLVRTRKTGG